VLVLAACTEVPGVEVAPSTYAERRLRVRLVRDLRDQLAASEDTTPPPAPEVSDALYTLGQALFHDPLLSGNRDVACSTCHSLGLGTDDDEALSVDAAGGFGPRNTPALFNLQGVDRMFWDSRVARDPIDGRLTTPAGPALSSEMSAVLAFGAIAAQALFPVADRHEMRGYPGENEVADLEDGDWTGIWAALQARLGEVPTYVTAFEDAYPGTPFGSMTFAHAAQALAGFELRAFDAADTPFDRFVAGDDRALTRAELRGGLLFFGDARCQGCHGGPNLSNGAPFDTATAQLGPGFGPGPGPGDDRGREEATGNPTDRYQFRTPPLRNVTETAPYGHAGQLPTLDSWVAHYQDPAGRLRAYDITTEVGDPRLHDQLYDNREDVLALITPFLTGVVEDPDVPLLTAFLGALTDGQAVDDLCGSVPSSVPSGLVVLDRCLGP
jgi:cytochrome c peroxidase